MYWCCTYVQAISGMPLLVFQQNQVPMIFRGSVQNIDVSARPSPWAFIIKVYISSSQSEKNILFGYLHFFHYKPLFAVIYCSLLRWRITWEEVKLHEWGREEISDFSKIIVLGLGILSTRHQLLKCFLSYSSS